MATWHPEIVITTAPLEARPNIWDGAAGASVDFWGVVRSLEDGREISGIEYEAHEALRSAAFSPLEKRKIVGQLLRKFGFAH